MGNCDANTNKDETNINLEMNKIIFIQRIWRKKYKKSLKNQISIRTITHNSLINNNGLSFHKGNVGVEIFDFDEDSFLSSALKETQNRIKASLKGIIFSEQPEYLVQKQLLYKDNSIYIGSFNPVTHLKQGFGILYTTERNKYIGEFDNDMPNGIGTLLFSDGAYYQGNFINGKQNGYGKYEEKDYLYIGDFINDLRNGKGEETFNNGTIFKGMFVNDSRLGIGILILPSGKSVEGYYDKDSVQGICRMINNDEEIISIGEWKNNTMNGINLFMWEKEKRFLGEYINSIKCGFGIFYWDGFVYEGYWINGKQHGFGRVTVAEEEPRISEWRYGIEINRIPENSEKYQIIKEEIEKLVEKLERFIYNLFGIRTIRDENLEEEVRAYKFSNANNNTD